MSNVVFVDTETTGLDPERHEIWDLAIIEANGNEHEWHFQPDLSRADPGALRINRYYERTLGHKWTWNDPGNYAEGIARYLANKRIVGAVPWFDAAFLAKYLRRYGEQEAWHYHMIDTETLAVGWLAGGAGRVWSPERAEPERASYQPPWDSDGLSFALGISAPDEDRHTAIGDARWARAMYEAVMGK